MYTVHVYERKMAKTYTQRALIPTMPSINHFLVYEKLLGFKGSASPPSQCTSNESFSVDGPLSASRFTSAVAVESSFIVTAILMYDVIRVA